MKSREKMTHGPEDVLPTTNIYARQGAYAQDRIGCGDERGSAEMLKTVNV